MAQAQDDVRVVCAANRGGVLIICSYDPRGNWNGERPFEFLTLDAAAKRCETVRECAMLSRVYIYVCEYVRK